MSTSSLLDFLDADLKKDLERVDELIDSAFQSRSALVGDVGGYLTESAGKKLRPAIAILSAQVCGRGADEPVLKLAAALELLHVATLLHDDVIDEAATRRNRPSVNAKWSNSIAILMADYLYARSFDFALATLKTEVLEMLVKVTSVMCEGELYQIEKEGQVLTREDYFRIIESKTAFLFSACAELGGLVAGAGEDSIARLREFGLNFGMAFQITDDTLDYTAADSHWGKPVGGDIAGGKQTLPLIYTLEVASPKDRSDLISQMSNGRDFGRVLEKVREYDGLSHAQSVARDYAGRAARCLDGWGPNGKTQVFRDLCDYVIQRGY